MTYIDETCAIFDNEEENKLSHTNSHMDFKELVERLLTEHLTEVGISAEDFYEACEVAYKSDEATDVARRIVEQLVACEDFLTFKAIMFRRNKELELEALMELESDDFESHDMAIASRKSSAEAKHDELLERQETADLEEALMLSEETERLKDLSLREKEQADLEAAIALSLAMEEQRLETLAQGDDEGKDDEGKSQENESKSSSESKSSAGFRQRSALPPIGGRKADLDIEEQRDILDQHRQTAEKTFSQPQRAVFEANTEVDEVDIARRKRHLEAQRKRLLAKKNAERAALLKEYEEQKRDNSKEASSPAAPSSDQRKISHQQRDLTQALARRMKQDLLDSGHGAGGMSALEEKLKQVEHMRQQRASLARGGF
eukprot:CAMPEP_0171573848 /NCGR_PEP_ID=MMETSP0961-20121227/5001_1 /TAXON_ID=87120 /ORGANISM="Aurantiochytrium limacinum, Strain ATCCMYA-1381" /LENGTH=374 /DNA_ID=CAMNT_0012129041 /DNA_START=143 /DNA_END=1267 /DNA_ORIENTATION=-